MHTKRKSYKTLKLEAVDCKLTINGTKPSSRVRGDKARPHKEFFFPRLFQSLEYIQSYKTLKLEAVDCKLTFNRTIV